MKSSSHYVIVWEFWVRPEKERDFIEKYGPDGTWARFFGSGWGYIRTELVRDVTDKQRFVTLDYWQSEEEFRNFRLQNQAEYERLDRECELLTETETCLGVLVGQTEISRAKG